MSAKWPLRRLGDLVEVLGGGTPDKARTEFWQGNIPWVSPKDMKVDEICDATDHISEEALKESACKLIPANAVLFVVRGMILAHTLPVAITRVPVAINQDMKALVPKPGILAEYLCWTLRAKGRALLARVEVAGHGTRRLPSEYWQAAEVSVPPLDEQHRIVARLDAIFERLERLAVLSSAVERDAAAILRAFRDKQWASIAASSPMMQLADCAASCKNGLYKPEEFHGSGVELLRMYNVTDGRMKLDRVARLQVTSSELDAWRVQPGDLLVSRVNSRDLVGKSAMYVGGLDNPVYEAMLMRLRFRRDGVLPEFAVIMMNSTECLADLRGRAKHAIGQSSINQKDLGSTRIPMPSREVQGRVASQYAALSDRVFAMRVEIAARESPASLRTAALRRVFAGEL